MVQKKVNLSNAFNKRMLHQPLLGLDGFFARASLQNRRKCERYVSKESRFTWSYVVDPIQ